MASLRAFGTNTRLDTGFAPGSRALCRMILTLPRRLRRSVTNLGDASMFWSGLELPRPACLRHAFRTMVPSRRALSHAERQVGAHGPVRAPRSEENARSFERAPPRGGLQKAGA